MTTAATHAATRAPRGQRAEGVIQVVILLAIGGCAAASSFTHVHNVAQAHGQPGWLAWADAVVLELMSIATGLEIRRRHRAAQPAGFVMWVLIAAVALSLSAQVVEAERSAVGWLAAALPALGFLACVKIVLTRNPAAASSAPTDLGPVLPAPVSSPAGPDHVAANPVEAAPVPIAAPNPSPDPAPTAKDDQDGQYGQDGADTGQDQTATGQDGADTGQDEQDSIPSAPDLITAARLAAATHRAATGRDITRDQLRATLRISTDAATDLLRTVRAETPRASLAPVPPAAFARVNGTLPAGDTR